MRLTVVIFGTALLLQAVANDEWVQLELPPPSPPPADLGETVLIEGGAFSMGVSRGRQNSIHTILSSPVHEETVTSFEIGKYEVTATEYCDFLNDLRSHGEETTKFIYVDHSSTIVRDGDAYTSRPGYDYAPAIHVPYLGARRYCEWLSVNTGESFRLPSEIEWEFAVRGVQGRTYPWGEAQPVGRAYLRAYYRAIETFRDPGVVQVGSFPEGATPEGVHDLIGNASEWCGNYLYAYSQDGITDDPDSFLCFANACEPIFTEFLEHESMFGLRSVVTDLVNTDEAHGMLLTVTRGGQYYDRKNRLVANGWTRFSAGSPTLVHRNGTSFRVLKVSGKRLKHIVRVNSGHP